MNSLVDYISSSDEEDDNNEMTLKRKERSNTPQEEQKDTKMPKLSSFFDKPSGTNKDNNGKIRKTPHLINSWQIHVYCKVDVSFAKDQISKYITNLNIESDPHISLSRPLFLKQHQLDSFASLLKKNLANEKAFNISFAQISQLTNDDKTRSFITLEIGQGYSELQSCLGKVDEVVDKYNLTQFYQPPRFHASIAWGLDEATVQQELENMPQDELMELTSQDSYLVSKIYCKMGNKIVTIDLQ